MKIRSPIKVFLLSIVTLGIYDLYWLVKTRADLNKETTKHVPTIWLIIIPFIVLGAGLILMIVGTRSLPATSSYSAGSYSFNNNSFNNTPTYASGSSVSNGNSSLSGLGVAGFVITIIAYLLFLTVVPYWFFKYSKSINEYTKGKMGTAVSFLLLWLLHFIGVALVQDAINDTLEAGPSTGAQPIGPSGQDPVAPMGQFPQTPPPAPMQPITSNPAPQPAEPMTMQTSAQVETMAQTPVTPESMQIPAQQSPSQVPQPQNAPAQQDPNNQPSSNNIVSPPDATTGQQ